MASARKCDRCGNYYDNNQSKSIRGFYVRGIRLSTGTPYIELDLCDECIDNLYDFLGLNEK